MVFENKFKELTLGKYSFIKPSRVELAVGARQVTLEMMVPYDKLDKTFDETNKREVYDAVRQIIPESLALILNYKKSYVDDAIAKKHCYDFMAKKYPSIPSDGVKIDAIIEESEVEVTININEIFIGAVDSKSLTSELVKHLHRFFTNNVIISLTQNSDNYDIEANIELDKEELYIRRRVVTLNHTKVTGKGIAVDPSYIVDHGEVEDSAVYCGKIIDFKENISKKTNNPYYVFTINDTSGRLVCKAFSKSINNEYKTLKIGDEIICQGKLAPDTFLHDTVLMVNNLSKCDIDYDSIVLMETYKKEPKYYENVMPYPYESALQTSLFGDAEDAPKSLIGRDFVVFDFETTGLDKNTCKIIELGAVKVVNGVIKECFSTFVNPKELISSEITNITSITDNDVKNAPVIEKVIPDFYKFSRNSSLVAHNAPFDTGFLYKAADVEKYAFDNKVYDTLTLAKKLIVSKNYKLGTLCDVCGISLEGAHRAINDCIATAQLFIHLMRVADRQERDLL